MFSFEEEFLYPPLAFLQGTGRSQEVRHGEGEKEVTVNVVEVRITLAAS
jgi:hypothetical protein